jgi:hypothetical protein
MALRRLGALKKRSSTEIVVPTVRAHARGSVEPPGASAASRPSAYRARKPHCAPSVAVVTVTWPTCEMEASASPRKPNVPIDCRSA